MRQWALFRPRGHSEVMSQQPHPLDDSLLPLGVTRHRPHATGIWRSLTIAQVFALWRRSSLDRCLALCPARGLLVNSYDPFNAKLTLRVLAVIVLAVALGLTLLWLGQRRMIYLPFGNVPPVASSNLSRAEDVAFPTDDGVTLHGWFVAAGATPARFTVIVFNGNAGHRGFRAPVAAALARHGVSTLLFDYRGYGDNGGRPSEDGLAHDARAALAYLTTRTDVDTARLVFFGESLGAAVALRPATESRPLALVLRSPFTSLSDIGRHHYPFLPVRLMLRDRYPSLERAKSVSCPTLVIAGDRDSIIPTEQSRSLYNALAVEKRLVIIAGADHNDEALFDGDELIQAVLDFMANLDRG